VASDLEQARLAEDTMSSDIKALRTILAVLKLPRKQVPLFVLRGHAICDAVDGNAWFPSPDPPLATIRAALLALSEADTAMLGRKNARGDRDEKKVVAKKLLERLMYHVQKTADENPEHAVAIIEGAGMFVKKPRTLAPRVLTAKDGPVSGSAAIVVPVAADRSSYEFAHSVDEQKTWFVHPSTTKASLVIHGLTPGTKVWFRYRVSVKGKMGDWSDAVSLFVR
jgi:hypothetical protein